MVGACLRNGFIYQFRSFGLLNLFFVQLGLLLFSVRIPGHETQSNNGLILSPQVVVLQFDERFLFISGHLHEPEPGLLSWIGQGLERIIIIRTDRALAFWRDLSGIIFALQLLASIVRAWPRCGGTSGISVTNSFGWWLLFLKIFLCALGRGTFPLTFLLFA